MDKRRKERGSSKKGNFLNLLACLLALLQERTAVDENGNVIVVIIGVL